MDPEEDCYYDFSDILIPKEDEVEDPVSLEEDCYYDFSDILIPKEDEVEDPVSLEELEESALIDIKKDETDSSQRDTRKEDTRPQTDSSLSMEDPSPLNYQKEDESVQDLSTLNPQTIVEPKPQSQNIKDLFNQLATSHKQQTTDQITPKQVFLAFVMMLFLFSICAPISIVSFAPSEFEYPPKEVFYPAVKFPRRGRYARGVSAIKEGVMPLRIARSVIALFKDVAVSIVAFFKTLCQKILLELVFPSSSNYKNVIASSILHVSTSIKYFFIKDDVAAGLLVFCPFLTKGDNRSTR
jgi:hypothetical protein